MSDTLRQMLFLNLHFNVSCYYVLAEASFIVLHAVWSRYVSLRAYFFACLDQKRLRFDRLHRHHHSLHRYSLHHYDRRRRRHFPPPPPHYHHHHHHPHHHRLPDSNLILHPKNTDFPNHLPRHHQAKHCAAVSNDSHSHNYSQCL